VRHEEKEAAAASAAAAEAAEMDEEEEEEEDEDAAGAAAAEAEDEEPAAALEPLARGSPLMRKSCLFANTSSTALDRSCVTTMKQTRRPSQSEN